MKEQRNNFIDCGGHHNLRNAIKGLQCWEDREPLMERTTATPAISRGRYQFRMAHAWLAIPSPIAGNRPSSTKHTVSYDLSKGSSLQTLYPHRWASVDCFSTHPSQTLVSLGAGGSTLWDFSKETVNKRLFGLERWLSG